MKVGGYSLDLYCDKVEPGNRVYDACGHRHDEFPHLFYGQTEAETVRQARARGWLVSDAQQLCPKCSGKRRKS